MKFRLLGRDSPKNAGQVNELSISNRGEALVRSFDYSDFDFKNINVANTAFNFFEAKTGEQFVITGMSISGNRDIGVNGAVLTIYTAETATSTTPLQTPFEVEVAKSTTLPYILPNLLPDENTFLNGKADDTNVRVGLFGYFVPA